MSGPSNLSKQRLDMVFVQDNVATATTARPEEAREIAARSRVTSSYQGLRVLRGLPRVLRGCVMPLAMRRRGGLRAPALRSVVDTLREIDLSSRSRAAARLDVHAAALPVGDGTDRSIEPVESFIHTSSFDPALSTSTLQSCQTPAVRYKHEPRLTNGRSARLVEPNSVIWCLPCRPLHRPHVGDQPSLLESSAAIRPSIVKNGPPSYPFTVVSRVWRTVGLHDVDLAEVHAIHLKLFLLHRGSGAVVCIAHRRTR